MKNLLCFLGLILVISIRLLHRYASRFNLGLNGWPAISSISDRSKPNVSETAHEGSRLLQTSESGPADLSPPGLFFDKRRRVVCSAAAIGYMAVNAFIIKRSTEEYNGAALLLQDPRFMLGRGGMFVAAIITMARAFAEKSPKISREIQADGLTLFALPFILRLLGTPGASERNSVLDLLVEPLLGVLCFLTGVFFFGE